MQATETIEIGSSFVCKITDNQEIQIFIYAYNIEY